jgi:hypothetical protein
VLSDSGPMSGQQSALVRLGPRPSLNGWYAAAAIVWFEALGLVALGAAVAVAPLSCWGDRLYSPAPADDACAAGQSPFLHDGLATAWLVMLIFVAGAAILLWLATANHRRARGAFLLVLAVSALTPIVWAATSSLFAALVVGVWTGIPAILLAGPAISLLTSRPSSSPVSSPWTKGA